MANALPVIDGLETIPMAHRCPTSPLDEEPEGDFTFADATLLTFLGVAAVAVTAVFLLGGICAEHRIAAMLALM